MNPGLAALGWTAIFEACTRERPIQPALPDREFLPGGITILSPRVPAECKGCGATLTSAACEYCRRIN